MVPNPFNPRQVSRISLTAEDVDAVVFWTRDPRPLLPHLDFLDDLGYRYYFLFTITGYGPAFEPNLPAENVRISAFCELSKRLGPERVIWRYDPIIISDQSDYDFHCRQFSRLGKMLSGQTRRVIFANACYYQKTKRRLSRGGIDFDENALGSVAMKSLLCDMRDSANGWGMELVNCCDPVDYSDIGIRRKGCVDAELINRLWGLALSEQKDPGQRKLCGCAKSRDIGVNHTCLHGCLYCYATTSHEAALRRNGEHDLEAPILWGTGNDP